MNKPINGAETLLSTNAKVAIIGGGVAGSTIALRFAELGIDTSIIEKGESLVNGPPICHLHAGGNLYREISDEQCLTLLQQSIDTVKVYPQSVYRRPTVIAIPKSDSGEPQELLPRLQMLQNRYAELVGLDASNRVLGAPEHYYRLFEREEVEALIDSPLPEKAESQTDWLVAFAQHTELDKLKFPIVLVQEYGLSAFRFAAIASLAAERLPSCHLYNKTQVVSLKQDTQSLRWRVSMQALGEGKVSHLYFDYVINACGFKSGEIDDMLSAKRERMVEFKAAYVAHWPECKGLWPEVIFYGERGTPQGMAQLTPYPDGYFQLHGMTQDITLFRDGLVASCEQSAQPKLAERFIDKIERQWPEHLVEQRTVGSIEHIAQYIPHFTQANVAAKPLFGAQQIPGVDADLRAADVSFHGKYYARTEIVKASSALAASDAILQDLLEHGLVKSRLIEQYAKQHYFPVTGMCSDDEVTARARLLASQRAYPQALANND
ncbi:FAD-dependent oxidoreductase [Shewanella woodyi]|uniref:FAD dependent oxidoreductase n=1 Tax=Shewanella woodyi (strain ATCC 51908 / MS32) TaxID=392500 RepID=B1KFJ0_SHEWM|nr:FAD-dependent oxidoreductase [Shewanella woodyi]ACA88165.1 FAD dependent oxidoreductase [Shewanella woodyi ATCC 51908]